MFGRIIVAHRQRLGLTQEALAQKAGLNVRSLRELEAGRIRSPRKSSVSLLADAFELTGAERERFCVAAAQSGDEPPATTFTPAQLPADVAFFTGRHSDLARLTALLTGAPQRSPCVAVISAISGTAGVGKTALAVHWAHRMADRFPDGHLYVNLRGFDAGERVVPPLDALRTLVGAMAVPPARIPSDLDTLVGLYRSIVAPRRVLIVLDNARDAEQVRPLLPGAGSAAVVVTSRNRLASLVAKEGAHPIAIDLLSVPEAADLLARRLGGDRVAAEPGAVEDLIAACARLPLALAIAAARAQHTGFALADVASELRDPGRRLDSLDAGDATSQVRAVFSWSYSVLTAPARRLFRLLGIHPGVEAIDAAAAATLADLPVIKTHRVLAELANASLLVEPAPGRYAFHDLLRAYAAERAVREDSPHQRRAALTRLFDHYLATAAAAMDVIFPAEAHSRPSVATPSAAAPGFAGVDSARAWLDTERPTFLAVAEHAATHGWPTHATRLSGTLFRYLDGGYHADAMAIHGHAIRAARRTGDVASEAAAVKRVGAAQAHTGNFQQAREYFETALRLYRQLGDRAGEAILLGNLGVVEQRLGHLHSAEAHHRQALAMSRRYCQPSEVTRMLSNLGQVENNLRRYDQATEHLQQALALARQHNDERGEAWASVNLCDAEIGLGRYRDADRHIARAIAIFQQQGNRVAEAWALDSLGVLRRHLNRPDEAAAHHRQALAIFGDVGERDGEIWQLNALGEAAHDAGRFSEAIDHHQAALAITTALAARDQQARSHAGLGRAHHALGNLTDAYQHYQRAVTIYTELDNPDADQIRGELHSKFGPVPAQKEHPIQRD